MTQLIFRLPLCYQMLTQRTSINFNIVSKGLGSDRMSYYLNEAASEMRELLAPTLQPPKAKL